MQVKVSVRTIMACDSSKAGIKQKVRRSGAPGITSF
jgi:hypothetical protein